MVARVMHSFGLKNLIIVSPRTDWLNDKSINAAKKANKIIKNVKVYDNLNMAIGKFNYVIATTNRKRYLEKVSINDFKIFKEKLDTYKKVAIVFGPENSGLSNEDISLSNFVLQIPTSKKFKSLNLSHSVTIICYELFKFLNKNLLKKKGTSLRISPKSEISLLVKHLIKLLETKDFFLPKEKKHSMIVNINNLIYRLEPNDKELRILASIINSLSKKNQ